LSFIAHSFPQGVIVVPKMPERSPIVIATNIISAHIRTQFLFNRRISQQSLQAPVCLSQWRRWLHQQS